MVAVGYPQPGPHDSLPATPSRAPGSVRRTTSIDMTRPDGPFGPVRADLRGQDVATGAGGEALIVGRLAATIEVDQPTGEVLVVATEAGGPLDALAGLTLRSGFGRALDAAARRRRGAVPGLQRAERPGRRLPGVGLRHPPLGPPGGQPGDGRTPGLGAGRCASAGSPAARWSRPCGGRVGRPVPYGPLAPVIEADDPLGWHPMAPMATGPSAAGACSTCRPRPPRCARRPDARRPEPLP